MNTEAEFLAAIAATPEDELAYRAFGDWLEERGDPRAAWVRSREVRRWMGPTLGSPVPALLDALRQKKNVTGARRAAEVVGEALVPGLVELLKHEDAGVRLQAAHCCQRMKKAAAGAVPALAEALKDADEEVRGQAAKAIKVCGAKHVKDTAIIQAALTDDNWRVRSQAAGILAGMGAKAETLEQLAGQLKDRKAAIRLAAVKGLGNLKSHAALVTLCRALQDKDSGVRPAAASFLREQVKFRMAEPVEPLRLALADPEVDVRWRVAEALGKIGPTAAAAVPDLLLLLDDGDPRVRREAATALGRIARGDEAALAGLERALADSDNYTADEAARALSEWPSLPRSCAAPLLALARRLGGDSWGRSTWPVLAMGKLAEPPASVIRFLREGVRRDDEDACQALGRLGAKAEAAIPDLAATALRGSWRGAEALGLMGPAGVVHLVKLLDGPEDQVVHFAISALKEAKADALPALPGLLAFFRVKDDSYRHTSRLRGVCAAIGAIGPEAAEAIPTLIDQLITDCADEARRALEHFGEAMAPHLPRLVTIFRDREQYRAHSVIAQMLLRLAITMPEMAGPLREAIRAAAPVEGGPQDRRARWAERTREVAARAFFFLKDVAHEAFPELLPLLRDPCVEVRQTAARVLGSIGRPEAVPALRAALRDGDEKVRLNVAVSLGNIGAADASPELVAALRDDSARVRREAATALGKVKAAAAAEALRQAADADVDKAVRREASAALKKIEGKKKGGG